MVIHFLFLYKNLSVFAHESNGYISSYYYFAISVVHLMYSDMFCVQMIKLVGKMSLWNRCYQFHFNGALISQNDNTFFSFKKPQDVSIRYDKQYYFY